MHPVSIVPFLWGCVNSVYVLHGREHRPQGVSHTVWYVKGRRGEEEGSHDRR